MTSNPVAQPVLRRTRLTNVRRGLKKDIVEPQGSTISGCRRWTGTQLTRLIAIRMRRRRSPRHRSCSRLRTKPAERRSS
jgi:hypothetical protein